MTIYSPIFSNVDFNEMIYSVVLGLPHIEMFLFIDTQLN